MRRHLFLITRILEVSRELELGVFAAVGLPVSRRCLVVSIQELDGYSSSIECSVVKVLRTGLWFLKGILNVVDELCLIEVGSQYGTFLS